MSGNRRIAACKISVAKHEDLIAFNSMMKDKYDEKFLKGNDIAEER